MEESMKCEQSQASDRLRSDPPSSSRVLEAANHHGMKMEYSNTVSGQIL
jgi:hypothetical protein